MKNSSIREFNIYCDETRVENKNSLKMAIGSVFIPRKEKSLLAQKIKNLKLKHLFYQEIKWNKVGGRYMNFYQELIDFFIKSKLLQFRCIVVDKKKIDYKSYHQDDKELAFFKFYYLMLRPKLHDFNKYYIFLDKKPTRDKNRARALNAFLDSHLLYNCEQSQIKHLQAYDSKDNVLIQLADFLTGLVGFVNNNKKSDNYKFQLAQYFQEKTKIELTETTNKTSQKINLLKWRPKL